MRRIGGGHGGWREKREDKAATIRRLMAELEETDRVAEGAQ